MLVTRSLLIAVLSSMAHSALAAGAEPQGEHAFNGTTVALNDKQAMEQQARLMESDESLGFVGAALGVVGAAASAGAIAYGPHGAKWAYNRVMNRERGSKSKEYFKKRNMPMPKFSHEETVMFEELLPQQEPWRTWDDIIGREDLKYKLETKVVERITARGVHSTSDVFVANANNDETEHILLYGPPGNGKTMTAQALSLKLGVPFLELPLGSLQDHHFGETSRRLAMLKSIIKKLGASILFIDEFEKLASHRTERDFEATAQLKAELLEFMDQVRRMGCVVIAATNFRDNIDFAIAGRRQFELSVGDPDAPQRKLELASYLDRYFPDDTSIERQRSRKTLQKLIDRLNAVDGDDKPIQTTAEERDDMAAAVHHVHEELVNDFSFDEREAVHNELVLASNNIPRGEDFTKDSQKQVSDLILNVIARIDAGRVFADRDAVLGRLTEATATLSSDDLNKLFKGVREVRDEKIHISVAHRLSKADEPLGFKYITAFNDIGEEMVDDIVRHYDENILAENDSTSDRGMKYGAAQRILSDFCNGPYLHKFKVTEGMFTRLAAKRREQKVASVEGKKKAEQAGQLTVETTNQ